MPATPERHRAAEGTRALTRWAHAGLKAWTCDPCPRRAAALRVRFAHVFGCRTDDATLDWLHRRKAGPLLFLQRPKNSLRAGDLKGGAWADVNKRTFSGSPMNTSSPTTRNASLGLMTPCSKLKVSLLRCFGDCLHTPGAIVVTASDLVHQAATII